MGNLNPGQIVALLAGLAILLGAATLMGELARRFRQPAIVGETLAGIFLGPSILGYVSPEVFHALFPQDGPGALALETFITVSVVLLLFVAGMEMDLSAMISHGRKAFVISVFGIVIPFSVGGIAAYYLPGALGKGSGTDTPTFALFFATALAISALPVIAKTLMDLNLLRTELGVLVMTGAMVNDLIGWLIFSVVLSMIGTGSHGHGIGLTIGFMGLLLVVVFAGIRPFVNRVLPWVQGRLVWPGGVLSFTLVLAFAFAALTEYIGIHATLGAFLVGVAVGDSPHLRERTREIIYYFVMHIFAPIFFAAIGLYVNIVTHFDLKIVAFVLVLATAGKVAGGYFGAKIGGFSRRESFAIGFGLNARGAMGIILALLARQYGVIEDEMFVALVLMALVTSVLGGPIMDALLPRRKRFRLLDVIDRRAFIPDLSAVTLDDAQRELVQIAAKRTGRSSDEIATALGWRERIGGPACKPGIAIPHARLASLRSPLVVIGRSSAGIPVPDADGARANLVLLLLTPREDQAIQLDLLADITARFERADAREAALRARSYNEFFAEISVGAIDAAYPSGAARVKDTVEGAETDE